ncbi:MAG: hypothetical protein MRY72_13045 [Aquisalinus sp.]|nr:hypothetical protein [Aquisalinus sp.]
MAYIPAGLSNLALGGAAENKVSNIFHYKTIDTAAQVEADGYFDAAADVFNEGKGDIIIASMDVDGTMKVKIYGVTRTSGDIALTLSSVTAG